MSDSLGNQNEDGGQTLDIERTAENPFSPGTYLYELFEEVLKENRDLIIAIDDYYGRRGTGKSIASLQLAEGLDQNEGVTSTKATMSPEEIINAYAEEPNRSALILDEGEVGASNRQAMTRTNQALREIMSMGRVEEKYVIVNTPVLEFLDKDVQKLADVWITMRRKGLGLVHALEREPYSGKLLRPKKQWISFNDVAKGHRARTVYNRLTREKKARIRGEDGGGYIAKDKHQEILERKSREVKKETRDEILTQIYNHEEAREDGVSQRILGEAVGLTQQAVGQIVR